MEIDSFIELIAESGNRGKELMLDSFIIGVAWGRKIVNSYQNIKMAAKYLYEINKNIEQVQFSSFKKLECFEKFLFDENFKLFPESQAKKKNIQREIQDSNLELTNRVVYEKTNKNIGFNGQLCKICDFHINDTKEEKYEMPHCKHQFHNLCLYLNIDQQEDKQMCPTCKTQTNPNFKEEIFKNISKSFKSCCPNMGCDQEFIYYGQQKFCCQKCNIQVCLKCKSLEHQEKCNITKDFYPMQLGQKFKICLDCNQREQIDLYPHTCKIQEKKRRNNDKKKV